MEFGRERGQGHGNRASKAGNRHECWPSHLDTDNDVKLSDLKVDENTVCSSVVM